MTNPKAYSRGTCQIYSPSPALGPLLSYTASSYPVKHPKSKDYKVEFVTFSTFHVENKAFLKCILCVRSLLYVSQFSVTMQKFLKLSSEK